MSTLRNIVVYPRGFLGYDIGLPVEKKSNDINAVITAIRYNKPAVTDDKIVISNTEISTLYNSLIGGGVSTRSFVFREKVLEAALKAFGTNDFSNWCDIQDSGPFFTALHKKFLIDTLNFISCGNRQMSIVTWSSIIKLRSATDDGSSFKHSAIDALGDKALEMQDVIIEWTSKRGGFEDLLITLYILFCNYDSK